MKIMHIISSPGAGGAEVYVKDLSSAMVDRGHQVLVLFLNRAADIGRDQGYEARFLQALTDKGIEYGFIGFRARRNPLYGIQRVRHFCTVFQPDVVHCHLYYAAVFCLPLRGPRILYTHHNFKLLAPRLLYKLLDLRMAGYIGICQACSQMLRRVTRRPVVRIDNAVAPHRIIQRHEQTGEAPPTILVVGRLAPGKNLPLLFNALALLHDLSFSVLVVGEGPDKLELETQVKRLKLDDTVTFLGNSSDVPRLMSQADIFAMSSAWEGLPIALLEATLTGLPVVVTNVGGCAEVVRHARNGLVVEEPTPENYAKALRRLIESPGMRSRLSRNALQYSDRYRLDTAVTAHLSLYQRLTCDAVAA